MPHSCPTCRASVAQTDAFCPNCGHILQRPSHTRQTNPSDAETIAFTPAPRTQPARPQRPAPQPAAQPAPDIRSRPAYPRPQAPSAPSRPWHARKRVMIPLVLLALLLVFGGALTLFVNSRLSTFNSITRPAPDSVPGQALAMAEQGSGADWGIVPPSSTSGTTMLLMGVDARDGESVDFGVRADSLSVLHLEGGTCRTLSIPRDTRTLLPGYGYSKVNHALAVGGVEYQTLVVEQLLGIEIDHFTLIDFDGMAGVVDAIGGVTVTTPTELSYEGVTVPAGTNTINGAQALVFARFRDDPEGDFGRQRRQQELLQAIIRQAGPIDAARAFPTVLSDLEGHLKTDLRTTGVASVGFGFLRGCLASGIENGGLDGSVGSDWDDLEGMELSFVHVPDTEISAKVGWLLDDAVAVTSSNLISGPAERRHTRT